jgi:hypothetical protein
MVWPRVGETRAFNAAESAIVVDHRP